MSTTVRGLGLTGDAFARSMLEARLWPDGPLAPLRDVLVICGSPRSGTTWLHNVLITSGRFKGIPADDLAPVGPDPFFTDENRYIHLSLAQAVVFGDPESAPALTFQAACNLVYLRFGVAGELMIKSPYYCFFMDAMLASGICRKFVFMKRRLDDIALSMMKHPHVGALIRSEYQRFFDVIVGPYNLELRYVDANIVDYTVRNYERLSLFDRALFKSLCFSASFALGSRAVDKQHVFIFDHEAYGTEPTERARFREFARLTEQQGQAIETSFRPPAARREALPPHDPEYRKAILAIENSLY